MANDAASLVSNDKSGLFEVKVRVRSVLVDGAGGEDGLPSAAAGEGDNDTSHNAAGSMDGDGLVGAGDAASSVEQVEAASAVEQVEASLQVEAEGAGPLDLARKWIR